MARGGVELKALCYKPRGREFETRWGEWIVFNLPKPSGRSRPLGFTQPLTEMSTKNRKIMFLSSKERPVRKADNLTAICEPIVYTM
jgi:hypothetical protein